MSNYYSKCFDYYYKVYNKIIKRLKTKDKVLEYMKNAPFNKGEVTPDSYYTHCIEVELFEKELNGIMTHIYFQESKLKQYLLDININDLEGISHYVMDNGISEEVTTASLRKNKIAQTNSYCLDFCIHIPNEIEGYCYSVLFTDNGYVNIHCIYNDRVINVSRSIKRNKKALINPKTESEIQNAHVFKLAINTISYIFAFPECLIDKKPEGIVLKYSFKNKKTILQMSEQFKKLEKEILVIPHFRQGHFRMFKSDRYINKKGEIIFINPTIVKGYKYKTLLTDPSIP